MEVIITKPDFNLESYLNVSLGFRIFLGFLFISFSEYFHCYLHLTLL